MTGQLAGAAAAIALVIAVALGVRFVHRRGQARPPLPVARARSPRSPGRLADALRRISIDQWRAIDGTAPPTGGADDGGASTVDARTVREPDEAGRASVRVLVVLLTVCVSLTLMEYMGGHNSYQRLFPPDGGRYWELYGYVWWSGWRLFGYVILPVIVLACLPGERIRDYHLSLDGFTRHLWLYAALFALILPAVLIASTTAAFRHTYPFYRLANRSYFDLVAWEVLYAVQFLSLEFFFRGFLLHGLRRALGANAIFVMLVPYCMIHYGKPLPETLGSIGAGLILGTIAMRTRSIWGGVLIHVGVASTMDVLALRGCSPIGGSPCR